jgi:hypothetical protein
MCPNNHPGANDDTMITSNLIKSFLEAIVQAKLVGSLQTECDLVTFCSIPAL